MDKGTFVFLALTFLMVRGNHQYENNNPNLEYVRRAGHLESAHPETAAMDSGRNGILRPFPHYSWPKRYFDEIDRAAMGGAFKKRTFDEIDTAAFGGLKKRNFDEIDTAAFDGIKKRGAY
ncbi:uncharacterized protein LOC111083447 [Limulus polyphemus]|uniref:Uncharacterized protein LOC111083447 n=1 Tax=Limulus polyphemus TaxID=6850 RepID=A0ABM1RWC2_LIMPO|nr:uncharacterized protein LOC111083447 [Limulus polyphemus]